MKIVTLKEWVTEFEKLTSEYLNSVNFETSVWSRCEISQCSDELQADAFENLSDGADHLEWVDYDESCEYRMDFQYELESCIKNWED